MSSFLQDPDLNRLIGELNSRLSRDEDEATDVALQVESAVTATDLAAARTRFESLLRQMVQRNATDLHLVVGVPAAFRINGEIRFASEEVAMTNDEVRALVPNSRLLDELKRGESVDFSVTTASTGGSRYRFRVNVHRQRGQMVASIRILPSEIPTLRQLNLPRTLLELTKPSRGLVLVCGPTGSGKSSTLAALLGEINNAQAKHIITIEDPLEYEHANVKSLVEQIEIGKDVGSFAGALRAALRQDPDVILVGEMRDLETVSIALTAAETGHLIFSTLHTSGPAQAINRIVDVYPANQQAQIYKQIALSLHAVLHQKLIPRKDGRGVVPVVELLLANTAVRHQIRLGKLENLHNEITLGKRLGMISFDESLRDLVHAGQITPDEALTRASDPDELRRILG